MNQQNDSEFTAIIFGESSI